MKLVCEEHTDAQAEVGKSMRRSNQPAPVIGLWPRVRSAPVAHFCRVISASLEGAPHTSQSAAPRTN